ncbi:MAG: hypothetical protein R3E64_07265 [Halioglobus sp.]
MDVLLVILGVLGFGAIAISTYVFTVAARTYVSEDHRLQRNHSADKPPSHIVPRNPIDRRSGRPVAFPLTVNGILIANDRRSLPDRRMAS